MPLVYQGDSGVGYVLITGHGHVQLSDWASAIAAQISDGLWHLPTLIDISDPFAVVSIAQTGAAIIRAVQELVHERGERGPLAMVLGNPELYVEGREYVQTFRNSLPHRMEIFPAREEAIEWLTNAGEARRDG